ncbi:MAG: hypothetical protein AAB250_06130, partial [Bdellovibrionota bacterium]
MNKLSLVVFSILLATGQVAQANSLQCFQLMKFGSKTNSEPRAAKRMIDFNIPHAQAAEGRARVDQAFLAETLFVVPKNDGEAIRAVDILQALGAPNLRVSKQAWGATLDKEGLPAQLPSHIKRLVAFEMPSVELETAYLEQGIEVVILDHHVYAGKGLDRTNPESSIEQLAKLVNWPLSKVDMAIAVNDRGYIPGMKAMGLKDAEIREIRTYDLIAQGRTAEQVAELTQISLGEIAKLKVEAGVTIIDRPVADEGILKQELAIRTSDGIAHTLLVTNKRISFSGDPKVVKALLDTDFVLLGYEAGTFDKYAGGDPKASMYFGMNIQQAPRGAKELVPLGIQRRIREVVRQTRLEGG